MTPHAPQNQYFSIKAFLLLSWRYKWLILITTIAFGAASVGLALSIPNQYKAEILVSPSEEEQGGGLSALANQFGGLASLAGINIRGKGADNTLLAIETIKSRSFIMDFIEKQSLLVPLMAAKDWVPATDTLVINEKIYDVDNKKWVRKVNYPYTPKPSDQEAYLAFRDRLTIERDMKSGTIQLSFEFYSPKLAQQWLTLFISEFNDHMLNLERARSSKSIGYLQAQIENTQVAELKSVFYQLIQEQTKKIMLAEARAEYMFRTIDPAIVPQLKSRPSRALICIFVTFLGFLLSLMAVHVRLAFISSPQPSTC